MERLIVVSKKACRRYGIIEQVEARRMTQMKAAEVLGMTDRHFRRLLKAYRQHGAAGLASKKGGKPSYNRLPDQLKTKVVRIVKKDLEGFGPTLAREKLIECYGIKVAVETLRKWIIEAGLWKPRKSKDKRVYQSRNRRNSLGELIQIDGSPHDWFEGRRDKCCLLGFIDDATSSVMHLKFVEAETTRDYLKAFQEYVEEHGRPEGCYSDRHSIFRINAKEDGYIQKGITQLGRALKELDIELICANSPQAKGRIERLFSTLQDRLVKELRLRKISTIEEANKYLPKYIKQHNKRFAVEAAQEGNKHRPLETDTALEEVLCFKTERKLTKNLELSYEGKILQIETDQPSYGLRGAQVTVKEQLDGKLIIDYRGRQLKHRELMVKSSQGKILDRKRVLGRTKNPQGKRVA